MRGQMLHLRLRQFVAAYFLISMLVCISADLSPNLRCEDELDTQWIMQGGAWASMEQLFEATIAPLPQSSTNCLEGCFCCCSHLIVSVRILPAVVFSDYGAVLLPVYTSLQSSSSPAFRPPRLV